VHDDNLRGWNGDSVINEQHHKFQSWALVPVQGIVGDFLETFKEYPPRAKAASFTVDQALEALSKGHGG
jgi:hypothetical protein